MLNGSNSFDDRRMTAYVPNSFRLGQAPLTIVAALVLFALPGGCSAENASFLDPQGPIAAAQRWHLIKVTAITMIAVLPVLVLVPFLLWRYRYGNRKARYTPNWEFSLVLDLLMWGVPFGIIAVLSTQLWHSTHALDPYKALDSKQPPLKVQVVGLDWKWLFIYPDQGIASVGELAFPADRPLALTLTTDTVMQSFLIASLAGQIYAMPGMKTKLHLKADKPGVFEGENTQFNGAGFQDQKFTAVAMNPEAFDAWVEKVKANGIPLDKQAYRVLGQRSTPAETRKALGTEGMPPTSLYFRNVAPGLFAQIIDKYHSGKPVGPAEQPGGARYTVQPQANTPAPLGGN